MPVSAFSEPFPEGVRGMFKFCLLTFMPDCGMLKVTDFFDEWGEFMNTDIDIAIEEAPPGDETADSYLTEEERQAIAEQEDALDAEEDARQLSRFSRGCLEVAGGFAALAAIVLLLGQVGICIGYELGQLVLPLTLACGSLIALCACLVSAYRKGLAAGVIITTIWFLVVTYGVTNFQFPEVIPTTLPHVEQPVVLTQITTPIGSTLCIDRILIPGVVSKRFKVHVHPRYIPLSYQVRMEWNDIENTVELFYNDQLWAVYDPERKHWSNVLQYTFEENGSDKK